MTTDGTGICRSLPAAISREAAAAICNDIRRRSAACNATTNCVGASCALSTAKRSRSKRWISAASRSCTGIRSTKSDNRLHGFGVHGRSHTEVVRRKVCALPAQISDPAGFRNGKDFRDRTRRFHTSYPEMKIFYSDVDSSDRSLFGVLERPPAALNGHLSDRIYTIRYQIVT